MRQWYTEKVDSWALGCILFELLTGITPFDESTVNKVLRRIQKGWYEVTLQSEPVCIETCLFLLECLQMHEKDRMDVDGLLTVPFISEEYAMRQLHTVTKSIYGSFQRQSLGGSARSMFQNYKFPKQS